MGYLLIGFVLSFILAYTAFTRQSLAFSGFLTAVFLGTCLYYFGGFYLWALLMAFFITSTLASKFQVSRKRKPGEIHERSGPRDWVQVVANGVLPLAYAVCFYFTGTTSFLVGYGAAVAAANSDTWSSEIGVLSDRPPVSILTFKEVDSGTSGGISKLGTTAGFLGSAFISGLFAMGYSGLIGQEVRLPLIFVLVTVTGFLGSLVDSLLGGWVQGKYRCVVCGKIMERRFHHGQSTTLIRGVRFISNDVVNFFSILIASLVAVGISHRW